MKKVQTLWIGEQLSQLGSLCLTSFLRHGHAVDLYAYGPLANVPEGINLLDANAVVPAAEIFTINGSYAYFSDYFRARLLYAEGGTWVDTDMVCLRPFDFDDDLVYAYQEAGVVCNAVLGLPAGHPVALNLLRRIEKPWECADIDLYLPKAMAGELSARFPGDDRETLIAKLLVAEGEKFVKDAFYLYSPFGSVAGPVGLTQVLDELGLRGTVKPSECFYPVNYDEWWTLFYDASLPEKLDLTGSYGLHLWNGSLHKYRFFDQAAPYQPGSLMQRLVSQYEAGVAARNASCAQLLTDLALA